MKPPVRLNCVLERWRLSYTRALWKNTILALFYAVFIELAPGKVHKNSLNGHSGSKMALWSGLGAVASTGATEYRDRRFAGFGPVASGCGIDAIRSATSIRDSMTPASAGYRMG
jgi:hypothetical protein